MTILALNHVGVRCTKQEAMEHFYIKVLGLKPHPSKPNWLLVGNTYAVHLMPPLAQLSEEAAHSVDAARHFALQVMHCVTAGLKASIALGQARNLTRHALLCQVNDLSSIVATLLNAGLRPYQLSLNRAEKKKDIVSPSQDLDFGIGTVFVENPEQLRGVCAHGTWHICNNQLQAGRMNQINCNLMRCDAKKTVSSTNAGKARSITTAVPTWGTAVAC